VDGVIHPCHWGCRQGTGIRGLIQQGLAELDVPVLNLEVDCVDARSFSEGQLRTRLEAFLELIAGRRRGRDLDPAEASVYDGRARGAGAPGGSGGS
jgi:hypothetical protein